MNLATLLRAFVVVCLILPPAVYADGDSSKKKLDDMSLEELLNVQVSVASKTESTVRSAPGVVTLITAEEIANSGARDITDLLQMVPGFTFGVDVEGVTSLGFRGNWVEEGKVLLLWDGQEMNDGLYGNIQLGNRFAVDQIKRIEIIRGPGSAIYGGFAELAVINVVTKDADDLKGAEAHVIYSQTSEGFARRDLSLAVGHKFTDSVSATASLFAGQMVNSDRNYADSAGDTYNLHDNARNNPMNLNVGVKAYDLELRGMLDYFRTTQRDAYGVNLSAPVRTNFDGAYFTAKYNVHPAPGMTLTPIFNYKRQLPWQANGPTPQIFDQDQVFFDVTYERYKEGIDYAWDILPNLNFQAGLELFQEDAFTNNPDVPFASGATRHSFNDRAVYAQGLWNSGIVDVTLGGRFDNHNEYGSSFVPRLGLTKQLDPWNFKFLLARAYRTPTIENIDANPDIKPEYTTDTELEAGYQINSTMFASLNFFNVSISQPIIYANDPLTNADSYKNYDQAGTRGFELQYRIKDKWGYANLGYSFYRPISGLITSYGVPADTGSLLGMPSHKLTISSTIDTPIPDLKVSPSIVWLSTRWAYTGYDTDGNQVLSKLSPVLLANLFVFHENTFVKGLRVGLGVNNIFNNDYLIAQPYTVPADATLHPPITMPGSAREALAKVDYNLPF